MEKINIKEKFGDWFLDIAKYVATASILSSLLTDTYEYWYVVASVLLLFAITIAFFLYRSCDKTSDRRVVNKFVKSKNKR